MDYKKKYLKYKNKYIMLKNQHGGSQVYSHDLMNTDYLIYSILEEDDKFIDLFRQVNDYITTFKPEIMIYQIPTGTWAQDLVQRIEIKPETEFKPTRFHFTLLADDYTTGHLDVDTFTKKINEINTNHTLMPIMKKITLKNKNQDANEFDLGKGGNYLFLPGLRKKWVSLVPETEMNKGICKFSPKLCLQVYNPNFDINLKPDTSVYHIDEIMTILPTSINDYIILFYKPVLEELEEKCDPDIISGLNEIWERNYKILKSIFPEEKIKLIETIFTQKGKIKNPPIFNRILVRDENKFLAIFPQQVDPQVSDIIDSIIEGINATGTIEITHHYIDTHILHNEGGNLHCRYKTIPKI